MRYLADTHVFLWWMADPDRLSPAVLSLVRSGAGEIAFSPVSGWEIATKRALGKVTGVPMDEIEKEIESLGWSELKFSLRHAAAVAALPFHHHDPFDRALIAQSIVEGLTFVSGDRSIPRYPVKVCW